MEGQRGEYPATKLEVEKMEIDARLARVRGNYEKASYLYGCAAKTWEQLDDLRQSKHCMAYALENKAKFFKENEKFKEYRASLTEAAKLWEELGEGKNLTWCKANISSSQAIKNYSEGNYNDAIKNYEIAIKLFEELGDKKTVEVCKAYLLANKARSIKSEGNYFEAHRLHFEAATLFKKLGLFDESLFCETDAWVSLAISEKKIADYKKAKDHFLVAAKIYEAVGREKEAYWCYGNIKFCDYLLAKYEGGYVNVEILLKNLYEAAENLEKSEDKVTTSMVRGDIYRFEGLGLKIQGKIADAIEKFSQAEQCYSKIIELVSSPEAIDFHRLTATYAKALKLNTLADLQLILSINPTEAVKNYAEACSLYKLTGDYKSATYCKHFQIVCEALSKVLEGQFGEAVKLWKEVAPYISPRIPEIPPRDLTLASVASLIGTLSKSISNRAEESIKEITELDKGPAFESRVRDLIRAFDDREFLDKKGEVFGVGEEVSVTLHKYATVERKIFKPQDDEVGIVFDDKTPIEIDIVAERMQRNRPYILIGECKKRPDKAATLEDLQLLLKKADFVQIRYEKIASLQDRYKPEIKEMWYVSIGGFTEEMKTTARKRGVKTINKNGLNILLKEFRQFRVNV